MPPNVELRLNAGRKGVVCRAVNTLGKKRARFDLSQG